MPGVGGGEQAVDLQLLRSALHRHRWMLVVVAAIGALFGLAWATLTPPAYSSMSVVLVATPPASSVQGLVLDPDTYAEIVRSSPVVDQAIADETSPLSPTELQRAISVSTPTDALVEIVVASVDPTEAAALSTAVSESFVEYVEQIMRPATEQANDEIQAQISELKVQANQVDEEVARIRERQPAAGESLSDRDAQLLASLTVERADLAVRISDLQEQLDKGSQSSSGSYVTARLLHGGDEPSRPSPILRWLVGVAVGALVGLVAGVVVAVRRVRLDARIRSIQFLSRTLGSSVAATLRSRSQRTPEGWRDLLNAYEPPAGDVWAVRLLLRSLNLHTGPDTPGGSPKHRRTSVPCLVVTSLSADRKGQSLGLVVAAAASSLGVRTAVAAAGDPDDAVDIWAGLALLRHGGDLRDNLVVTAEPAGVEGCDLQIVLSSVDPRRPRFGELPNADGHLIAVSAGVTDVEELSRVSLAAFTSGHAITGALVADPDEWDEQGTPWVEEQPAVSRGQGAVIALSPTSPNDHRLLGGEQ